jgi:hypothetical protein
MKPLTTFAYALLSVGILVSLVSAPSAVLAAIIKITPTIDGTIRDGLDSPKDGIPDAVLERSIVQVLNVERPSQPFEDRGIIEFDISNLSLPLPKIELILTVFSSNGPFPFTINVFTYIGDGVLSLADFNAGSFFTSFEYSGESTVILDVTTFIRRLVASGETFAGFNFRFAVPSTIPLNGPFVAFNSLEFPPAALLQQAGLCTLNLQATLIDRMLKLDFDVGTLEPANWNVWLTAQSAITPVVSAALPVIEPPTSIELNLPFFPALGTVGFLTTLTTPVQGIICSEFVTVDTGSSRQAAVPSPQALQDLLAPSVKGLHDQLQQHMRFP